MGKLLGSILRFLFSWIDSIIVRLITVLYRLLSDLSELVLYSDNIIKLIGRRIGLILGIFMLFKLAISLINYMISPDKISDKSKGGGRLIINVGVSLALLISINFIFKEAYMIQGVIVNSHIIEKIFFGEKGLIKSNNDYSDDSNNPTEKMDIGYYLYSAFFIPNNDVFGDVCDDMWDISLDWNEKKPGQSKSCYETLEDELDDEEMKSLGNSRNSLDMSYVLKDYDLVNEYDEETRNYYFNYTPIVSTVAGVVVLLVLLSFSMDLATRAVKLLFLQIIAPIPIISNMDMGKGQDIFKKWGKECINTYLTVFIRLIAINFAVFMIVLLKGDYKSLFTNNIWLNIFLIIGCLMFAKQVPHLIEEFLGIKLNGMALHPLKKFQEQALFGKQITGVAGGLVAGTGAGLLAAGSNVIAPGAGGRLLGSAAGFTSAFGRGVMSGAKGEKINKAFSSSYNTAMANKQSRKDRKDDNVGWGEMMYSRAAQTMGLHTKSDVIKSINDNLSKIQNAYKDIQSQAAAMDENKDKDGNKVRFSASKYATGEASNSAIEAFRNMKFTGVKELAKYKAEIAKTQLDRKNFNNDSEYQNAVKVQQELLDDIQGVIDNRTQAIVTGESSTGDASTDRVMRDAYDTMKKAAGSFNDSIGSIDSNIEAIDLSETTTAKIINGQSQGRSAAVSSSPDVQHIQDVQQYGAKKDSK